MRWTLPASEPLESRRLFAASAGLDPNYLLSLADIRGALGDEASVYQAEPAANGRTYLLARRLEHKTVDGFGRLVAYLAFVAVGPDGKPDPAFSGDGIALTSRRLSQPGSSLLPGIMRVDDVGRIYFADATRVLRFKADGSPDRTFGDRGAVGYSPAKRPEQLCDMVVTDDGVLLATVSTSDHVEHFAVRKIDGDAEVTWQASHDVGVADDENGQTFAVDSNTAQFARSHGRIVLARLESDGEEYPNTNTDIDTDQPVLGVRKKDVVVTRFDASGRGTDVIRRELKQSNRPNSHANGGPEETILGDNNGIFSRAVGGNVLLGGNGRTVIVQTDLETIRIDLKARTARRALLPGPDGPRSADKHGVPPSYQLLPDGGLASFENAFDRRQREVTQLYRYRPDGTLDRTFGDNGKFVIDRSDYVSGTVNIVDQVFLDSSGRLNFIATGRYVGTPSDLTLRRV